MARDRKRENWCDPKGRMTSPSAPDPTGWSTRSSYSWLFYAGLAITLVAAVIVFLSFGHTLFERIAHVINGPAPATDSAEHLSSGTPFGAEVGSARPPHMAGQGQDLSLSELGLLKPEHGNAEKPAQAAGDKHSPPDRAVSSHAEAGAESAPPTDGRDQPQASPAQQSTTPQPSVSRHQPAETTDSAQKRTSRLESTTTTTTEAPPEGQAANQTSEPSAAQSITSADAMSEPDASSTPHRETPVSETPAESLQEPVAKYEFAAPDSARIARLEPQITRPVTPSLSSPSPQSTDLPGSSKAQQTTNTRREITILLAEGDSSYVIGELELARIAYRSAFEKGNAEAARRLGETFDPVQLERDGWSQKYASPSEAILWYEDAERLGDAYATERLDDLLLWLSRSAASGNVEAQRVLDIWRERQS